MNNFFWSELIALGLQADGLKPLWSAENWKAKSEGLAANVESDISCMQDLS